MRDKKAIGHIEVIISFVIFIGFVLFLLTFLNPIKNKEVSQAVLDFAERGILSEASVDYNYTSVKTNEAQNGNFFIDFSRVNGISERIIIKSEVGVIRGAIQSNKLYIDGDGSKFYTVYSSPEFNIPAYTFEEAVELSEDEGEYSIGLLRKNRVLSDSKIIELKNRYDTNYDELKAEFKIPDSNDFGFVITSATGEEIIKAVKNQPSKISIIAKDISLQMLDYNEENNAWEIKYVVLNIQAW